MGRGRCSFPVLRHLQFPTSLFLLSCPAERPANDDRLRWAGRCRRRCALEANDPRPATPLRRLAFAAVWFPQGAVVRARLPVPVHPPHLGRQLQRLLVPRPLGTRHHESGEPVRPDSSRVLAGSLHSIQSVRSPQLPATTARWTVRRPPTLFLSAGFVKLGAVGRDKLPQFRYFPIPKLCASWTASSNKLARRLQCVSLILRSQERFLWSRGYRFLFVFVIRSRFTAKTRRAGTFRRSLEDGFLPRSELLGSEGRAVTDHCVGLGRGRSRILFLVKAGHFA